MKKESYLFRRILSTMLALILCLVITVNMSALTGFAKEYKNGLHIYVGDISVGDIVESGVTLHSTGDSQGYKSFGVYFDGVKINSNDYEMLFDRRAMLVAREDDKQDQERLIMRFEDFNSEGEADSENTLKARLFSTEIINLSGDIELESSLEINDGKRHVINTNGFTITRITQGKTDKGGIIRLTNGTILSINDMSTDSTTFMTGGKANEGGCIYVDGNSKLTLYNISLSANNANSGGAIFVKNGSIELNRCTIDSNSSQKNGSALYIDTAASAELTDCRIENNDAYDGGIYNLGNLTVTRSFITGNTAKGGGAGIWSKGNATLEKSEITNNTNAINGGGILNHKDMTIKGCNVSGNYSSSAGGGLFVDTDGKTEISESCSFSGNNSSSGAGIYVHKGNLTVSQSTIENNASGEAGGGLWANEKTVVSLTETVVMNNTCKTNGGALNSHGTLNINGCIINSCSSGNFGGAVYIDSNEGVRIEGCEITNCISAKGGGGVYIYAGSLTLAGGKTRITGNTTGGSADNILFRNFRKMIIRGKFDEDSAIGFVPPQNTDDAVITTDYGKYNDAAPETIFTCDTNDYNARLNKKTLEVKLVRKINKDFSSYHVKVNIKVTDDADWWDYAYLYIYAKDNKGKGVEKRVKASENFYKSIDDEDEEYTFEYDCGEDNFPSAVNIQTSFGSWGTWRDFEADVKIYVNDVNCASQHIVHEVYGDEEKNTKVVISGDKYPYPEDFEVDMAEKINPRKEETKIVTIKATDQYGLTWKANSKNAIMKSITFPDEDTFEPVDDTGLKWKLNSTNATNHQSTYELTFKSGSSVYPEITNVINVQFDFLLHLTVIVDGQEVMHATGYDGDKVKVSDLAGPTGYYIAGYTQEGTGILIKNEEKANDYDFILRFESAVLTANLKTINYKITYDKNVPKGEKSRVKGSMSSKTAKYDTEIKLDENKYTRSGYTFVAWNTQPDGMGKMYEDKERVKNLTSEKGAVVTLYAVWKPVGASTTASIFSYNLLFIYIGAAALLIAIIVSVVYSVRRKKAQKEKNEG